MPRFVIFRLESQVLFPRDAEQLGFKVDILPRCENDFLVACAGLQKELAAYELLSVGGSKQPAQFILRIRNGVFLLVLRPVLVKHEPLDAVFLEEGNDIFEPVVNRAITEQFPVYLPGLAKERTKLSRSRRSSSSRYVLGHDSRNWVRAIR